LSALACTSSRNLARLFAEHARCSPLDYVQLMRFAFARQLVTHSRLDLERVAAKAGFRSASTAARVVALGSAPAECAAQPRAVRAVVSGSRLAHLSRSSVDCDFAATA